MTSNELISSGELEMYVAGLLTEERAIEISKIIEKDKLVKQEVEAIEALIMRLAKESNGGIKQDFSRVLKKIVTDKIVGKGTIKLEPKETVKQEGRVIRLKTAITWAAAVCLLFFAIQYKNTTTLNDDLKLSVAENKALQERIQQQESTIDFKETLLATITSDDTKIVTLAGQTISPDSKAKVFWSAKEDKVIVDAANLPIAPKGMVYQVWSLKMNPLTPKSLGLLDGHTQKNKFFTLNNSDLSEGFGITLEPSGGSKTPTLEQLYVLGAINA